MLKERQSNFEILRIVAMIMIVACHYAGRISAEFFIGEVTFNRVLNQILGFGGGAGNITFFLLSGYFWKDSADNRKHILRLWLEMAFYSILCMSIATVISGKSSVRLVIAAIFPFSHGEYWFMTAYIALMLLMPYINILIRNLDKESHRRLLTMLFILTSIIPTIPGCPSTLFSDIVFYFFIYLVGVYLRRYTDNNFGRMKLYLIVAAILSIILIGSVVVFDILGIENSHFIDNSGYFLKMTSPVAIFWVLSVFFIFRNIKMKNNKVINYISGSVLGVFLIHNNKNIRDIMWNIIFKDVQIESPYLSLHLILSVIGIFVVCVLIDAIRREIVEKPILRLINKYF